MQFRLGLLLLVISGFILAANTSVSPFVLNTFGQKTTASDLFETKSLKLSPNIKHLVILIPNEGHESQNAGDSSSDQRLINQPYIPQRATVNPGTIIVWFNGDVDHDHQITLTNGANQDDPDYVMNGTIDVVSQQGPDANSITNTNAPGSADTSGALMVPASDVDTYAQDLKNNGFAVDSIQNFNDIRAGDEQVLLVWTTSGIDLDKVVSTLQRITQTLPYS